MLFLDCLCFDECGFNTRAEMMTWLLNNYIGWVRSLFPNRPLFSTLPFPAIPMRKNSSCAVDYSEDILTLPRRFPGVVLFSEIYQG